MLRDKEERSYNYNIDMIEYLASFWNSEAVQKIRTLREMEGDTRFASDEEFERQIIEEEYKKNDELVRSIRDKYKNTNLDGSDRDRSGRNTRMPKDMSRLFKMTGDE
jgi:hypothetical protein